MKMGANGQQSGPEHQEVSKGLLWSTNAKRRTTAHWKRHLMMRVCGCRTIVNRESKSTKQTSVCHVTGSLKIRYGIRERKCLCWYLLVHAYSVNSQSLQCEYVRTTGVWDKERQKTEEWRVSNEAEFHCFPNCWDGLWTTHELVPIDSSYSWAQSTLCNRLRIRITDQDFDDNQKPEKLPSINGIDVFPSD